MMGRLLIAAIALLTVLAAPSSAQGTRPSIGTDVVRRVGPKDNLYTLAYAHRLGLDAVATCNSLPMQLEIPAGNFVTLPTRRVLPANPPRDGMVLNIPERGLYLFRDGRFVQFYPVAVGRHGFLTPRGSFRVTEKITDPTWHPPAWADSREAVGPGGKNPLGDRWIGTSSPLLGLHGTQSPYSIGMSISHGCIRLYPEHIRTLFGQVRIGMPIRFEYETAKVGRDPSSGRFYLATFPDVYHLQDPVAAALAAVRDAGLSDRISDEDVKALATQNYQAAALLDSDFQARVVDRPIALKVSPLVRGQALWLPAELIRELGMTVVEDRSAGTLIVTRKDVAMLCSLTAARPPPIEPADNRGKTVTDENGHTVREIVVEDGKPVSTAYAWRSRVYVRADDLFDYYNIRYEWKPVANSLTVWP